MGKKRFFYFGCSEKNILRTLLSFLFILSNASLKAEDDKTGIRINLEQKDMTVTELFSSIKMKTGITCMYEESVINSDAKVTLTRNDYKLNDLLLELCSKFNLEYIVRDEYILFKVDKKTASEYNQNVRTVSGRIIDKTTKTPLYGANIFLVNIRKGTISGNDGEFIIHMSKTVETELLITFLGMENYSCKIDRKSVV